LGFRVQGLNVRVSEFGFRVQGLNVRASELGFRVQGLNVRVSELGFRIDASPKPPERLRELLTGPPQHSSMARRVPHIVRRRGKVDM
jgi:hypothetical protein